MDNYDKLRVIGKGSYGEVFLVKHKRDRKQYVLKKLDVHNASKRERAAAEQEAKLLSKLKHPNIVSYKDSFETEDGHLYIAMGYCEGGDLYNRLKEQKSISLEERQIVEWFVQIAMALQYMHERHILHRDLKTQNIFLTKSKIIKVGDLGIARVLDTSSDMATTLIGTPYYMSPELFSNKPYNHKSDVWALGCCVYEMTTLKHAFNAKDMNSLVYKILRGKMPNMPKQYSTELVTLIKAMLNHNPDRRPSVSRILRDTYIKKNIALFLENSKKEKQRPSSARSTRSDNGDKRRDETDGPPPKPRERRARPPDIVVRDENLEPLDVAPELAPITEEEMEGTAESQRSRKQSSMERRPPSSPTSRINRPSENRGERRAFKPSGESQGVVVALDTDSPSNSAKRPDISDASPTRHKKLSHGAYGSSEKLNSSDESQKGRRQRSGHRPNSKERERISPSSSSSSLSSKDKSPDSPKKSVLDNPRQVPKPRPLPRPADSAITPRESSKNPQSTKSSRGAGNGRSVESGYVSAPAASDSVKDRRPSIDLETPRSSANLSARERRRERKDRETPREPISARSFDVNLRRPSLEGPPKLSRPSHASGAKSEDYTRDAYSDPSDRPRSSRNTKSDSRQGPSGEVRKPRLRQPSIDDDSSEEEAGTNENEQKENQRNAKPPVTKPQLIQNTPNLGPRLPSNHSNTGHAGRVPLKAKHPSSPENDSDTADDERRKDKDMNNFICLLNTTLQMNQKDDNDDDDDDDFVGDVELAPPGRTGFIHLRSLPSKGEGDGGNDDVKNEKAVVKNEGEVLVPVLEVESIKGHPNQFNVNISSPTAGMRTLTTTGRLWARITDLRKDCIRGLGVEKIKRAYDILDNFDAEELEPQLIQLFGDKDFELYAGKIWQLKFCEEAAFGLI